MAVSLYGYVDYSGGSTAVIATVKAALIAAGWTDMAVSGRTVLQTGASSQGHQAYVELSDASGRIQIEVGSTFTGTAFVGNSYVRQSSGTGGNQNLLWIDTSWFILAGMPIDLSASFLQEAVFGGGVINPLDPTNDAEVHWVVGEYNSSGAIMDICLVGADGDNAIVIHLADGTATGATWMWPGSENSNPADVPEFTDYYGVCLSKYVLPGQNTDELRTVKGYIDNLAILIGRARTAQASFKCCLDQDGDYWLSLGQINTTSTYFRASRSLAINVGPTFFDATWWDQLSE